MCSSSSSSSSCAHMTSSAPSCNGVPAIARCDSAAQPLAADVGVLVGKFVGRTVGAALGVAIGIRDVVGAMLGSGVGIADGIPMQQPRAFGVDVPLRHISVWKSCPPVAAHEAFDE